MIVRIVAAATATALLVHSLLGCCWHHDHAGCAGHESDCLLAGAHDEHHHAESATAGPTGPQDDDEDSDHQHRSACIEPSCSFVGADGPPVIDMPWIGTIESGSGAAVCGSRAAVEAGFSTRIDRAPLSTARMRAVLQMWVV
jgi:hypothetical protein